MENNRWHYKTPIMDLANVDVLVMLRHRRVSVEEKIAFFREKASNIFQQLRVHVYDDEYTQHARGLLDLMEDIDEYSQHVKKVGI